MHNFTLVITPSIEIIAQSSLGSILAVHYHITYWYYGDTPASIAVL